MHDNVKNRLRHISSLPFLLAMIACLILTACSEESPEDQDPGPAAGAQASGSDPASTPVPDGPLACSALPSHLQVRFLELVNAVRSEPQQCGDDARDATEPLEWDNRLEQAARTHSEDMAEHNFFDHSGSDGSRIGARVTAVGYRWRRVGENIAGGQDSAAAAVSAWVNSPGHCRNLMDPTFTHMAVACVERGGTDLEQYWTQVLALPQ